METTVEKQLLSFGIEPHLLNGRGHHFIWRIRRDSKSFDQLRALGHPTQSILSHYERTASPGGAKIDLALGAAYHGLGQAIEYLAAEVKRLSAASSTIPVELTAVEVGPGERGREMISLDISELETLSIAGLPECPTADTSNLNSTRPRWETVHRQLAADF